MRVAGGQDHLEHAVVYGQNGHIKDSLHSLVPCRVMIRDSQSPAEASALCELFGKIFHLRRDDDSWLSINFCGGGCPVQSKVLLSRRTGIVALNPPPLPNFFFFFRP